MSTQKCTIVTLPEMIRMIEVEVVFISPLNAEHRFLIGYTVSFLPVENFQASPFLCVCVCGGGGVVRGGGWRGCTLLIVWVYRCTDSGHFRFGHCTAIHCNNVCCAYKALFLFCFRDR